jgi:uncharacterized ferritin-like protein (DUF455 family)
LRDDALTDQLGVMLVDKRGVHDRSAVLGELCNLGAFIGRFPVHDHLEWQRIDERTALPDLHRCVVVARPGLDVSRDIRAHLGGHHRIERPGHGDASDGYPRAVTLAVT